MKSTLKCVSGMASLCVHSFVIWGPLFLKREFFIPSEENIFSISSPFCQLSFRERIIAPLTKEGPRLTVFQLSIYFSNFKTQFEIVVYILAIIVLLSTSVLQILALWRYMLCSCLMDVFVYAVGEVHSEFLTFRAFPTWPCLPGRFPSSPPSLVFLPHQLWLFPFTALLVMTGMCNTGAGVAHWLLSFMCLYY